MVSWGRLAALAAVALAFGPGQARGADVGGRLRRRDVERGALADKKRDEAIAQLQQAISRFDDGSPDKPDLYFQLSELYWEKFGYLYTEEEERHEEAYRRHQEALAAGRQSREPPPVDHQESERYRTQAMRFYEIILRDHRDYARTDEVLFSLAYNLHETGKPDMAAQRYEELISRFPRSQFIPDAHVQLGEHWFRRNDLARARASFEKAFESGEPKIHSYALYKLAWCDYNAGDMEGALRKLHEVVDFAERRKDMVDLRNEALKDMVLPYVRLGRGEDGVAYFLKKAPAPRQAGLIAGLARGLAEAGQHEPSIRIFRGLIERDPLKPDVAGYQREIVQSYEGLRQRNKVKEEIRRLAELVRPGSAWRKANEGNREGLRDALEVPEEVIRVLATDYHQEAQRTRQVQTYRLARDLYEQYVGTFASGQDPELISDHAFNLRFYLAETLWALEEWEAAATEYDAVVAFKIPDRQTAREVSNEQYRRSAAYNSILAWAKLLKIARGQLTRSNLRDGEKVDEQKDKGSVERQARPTRPAAGDQPEQPLTSIEERLVAACDTYVRLFPGEQDEIDVRYQAAALYYDRNHLEEALQRFEEIIARWPGERLSQEAADLTMYALEARARWKELSEVSRRFLVDKRLARPGTEFARRVAAVVEGSRYKWIDEVVNKQEGDPARAAEELLAFVQEWPRAKLADKALVYAMLLFQQTSQLDRGIAAGERVLKEYPGTPLEPKVRYTLAGLYEKIADFRRAAEMYESFVAAYDRRASARAAARRRRGEKDKKERAAKEKDESPARPDEEQKLLEEAKGWLADALFNAALWHEALGRTDKALAAYRSYLGRFRDRKDAPEVQSLLARALERSGRFAEASRALEEYEQRYGAKVDPAQAYLVRHRRLEAVRTAGNAREAERLQDALIGGFARLPEAARKDDAVLSAYAHARFLAIEPLWEAYTGVKFKRVSTVRRDLQLKQRKLQELEQAYTEVLAIGDGQWGIAALVRIGLAYADLARNITESPVPRGLDQGQAELYRAELENLANPIADKALEVLEKGVEKSSELAVYSDWMLLAQETINRYHPGRYPSARPVVFRPSEPLATEETRLAEGGAEMEAAVRAVLVRHPDDAEAYKELPLIYYEQGNYRLAELVTATARRLAPEDPGLHNTLGLIYLKLDNVPGALAQFRQAVSLDDSFAPAHFNLGALALEYRDYAAAARALARVVELEPTSYAGHLYYAYALDGARVRDTERGIEAGAAFEAALGLRSEAPEAICGAGWAYAADRAGWEKAVGFLERCRALSRPEEQQRIDAKLRSIAAARAAPGEVSPPQR